MYLTRIALDSKRRETMRALSSPGVLHGAVERCFEGERARSLWRTDVLHGTTYLLILSAAKPSCAHIAEQFGSSGDAGETKDYGPLLARIEPGQRWRFRLRANPVRSVSRGSDAERGRVYAHVTLEQQKQWLLERAEKNGFALDPDEFNVMDTRWEIFKKHGDERRKVTLRTATFEGILTVTDADAFIRTLTEGIGRAKAYGCGLLTVMRL